MNEAKKEIIEISVDDIIPNRFQPRLTFDMEALNELANSIREHGIIQPLVVRSLGDKYEIIAGERRFKAASLIGMQKVPCIVMNLNDNESAEVAVIENIQRKEMTPLEEAKSFKKILDKGYLTQEELAKRMGKSQSAVANKLRLLNLDDVVQDAILNGKISERHARSLLKISSKQDQRNLLSEILDKRLTVRQLDDLIKEKYVDRVDKMSDDLNNNQKVNNFNNINDNIFKTPVVEVKEEPTPVYPSMPNVTLPTGISSNPQINLINDVNKLYETNNDSIKEVEVNNSKALNINDIINPSVFNNQTSNISSNNTNLNDNTNNKLKVNDNLNINQFATTSNSDIFKTINNNVEELTKKEDYNIQQIINPSVLSENNSDNNSTNNINNSNESFNVDIANIKNNAQDILQKEENKSNIAELLNSDKQENKFFVDLNVKEEDLQFGNLPFKIQSAVDSLDRKVNEIKFQGIKVTKEEKDLGNTYEIIIKIEK